MLDAPDMVGGTYDNTDTDLMRRRPRSIVSKCGSDGLRGIGLLDGADARGTGPAGLAIKIEDGDGADRASKAVTVEALAQVGVLDERDLRALADYHHPLTIGPNGVEVAAALPRFELAPLNELT
jgi:L-asparaginase II